MQTPMNDNPLMALLALPAVDRTRRNHALEHATLNVLTQRNRQIGLVGRSTPGGFHIYGNVSTEALRDAAAEALARLQDGEVDLAARCWHGLVYQQASQGRGTDRDGGAAR